MGAKTGLIAYSDGDLIEGLRGATRPDPVGTEALVELVHPGWKRTPVKGNTLWDGTYPPEDIVFAASMPGVDLVCSRALMVDYPSRLPGALVEAGKGRRLVRSLSLSPDGGIMEDIGERFPFELPYWAGEHPVEPTPGWPDQGPYPLPFHPLDMGEEALRNLFGFAIEGLPGLEDVDAEGVELLGFRVEDPDAEAVAARKAELDALLKAMRPPRRFRLQADGSFAEIVEGL